MSNYRCLVYFNGTLQKERKNDSSYGSYILDQDYNPIFFHAVNKNDRIYVLFFFHGKLIKRIDYIADWTYPENILNFLKKEEDHYDLAAFV